MLIRVLVAGVIAGVLVFGAGVFEHMVLGWSGRTMSHLPSESAAAEFVKSQSLQPGIYGFPDLPANLQELSSGEQTRAMNEINERYKTGPNGWIIIGPTGQDIMGAAQLGGELALNTACALIAAWIASLLAPRSFALRWVVVLLMGLFAWLTMSAPQYLWYRFPGPFVRDELLAALLDWGVGGLAIAAIARPCGKCSQASETDTASQTAVGKVSAMAK